MKTYTKEMSAGIWEKEATAAVYTDRVTVKYPAIKWGGDTGSLEWKKIIFRGAEADNIKSLFSTDDESTAWEKIKWLISEKCIEDASK